VSARPPSAPSAELAARRAAGLAALGPFFVVQLHPPGAAGGWRPLAALLGAPGVLAAQIALTRAALAGDRPAAAVPLRVAASVTHLGLAARCLSPAFGLAVLSGVVPAMLPDQVRWQPAPSGPVRLSLPAAALGGPAPAQWRAADLAGELAALLDGPVRLLTEAVATRSVSRSVLAGNVASAVNGAATVVAAARPALGRRTIALRAALLHSPSLAGTGTLTGAGFRRRSCCLIYQAALPADRAFCADCILRR
jgi:hypothetical protein